MKKILVSLATVVSVCISAPAAQAADEIGDANVTQVVFEEEKTPASGSVLTLTFDNPAEVGQLEIQLERKSGKELSIEVAGDTALVTTDAPSAPRRAPLIGKVSARDSNLGDNNIYCNRSDSFADSNVTFYVTRECGVRAAPWALRLSGYMQSLCTSYVSELGMQWTKNGVTQPAGASHYVPDDYFFHGTFRGHNGVGAGDVVNWYDSFACRHSIGGGGNVLLDVYGTLRFRSAG